ncbi:MarR family transcriptional regulator (plasmid) [Deinococcus taeanensis]|uniref:MarR family winged helix-turn-helix transcriptional regulator n=1 Tax=Deinococcus taeanensis TaxID=2737050 RepID=UPI001CDD838A|nr:MarR family transcriptional regulator [Deinococcus taeanensis]UBV45122.1 MarR family transcriptional regulator [Deinococcus taeanensis]
MPGTRAFLARIESDWAQVRPDLNAAPMLSVLRLTRLGAALQSHVDDLLRRENLNAAGWDLLLTLYRSAPAEGLSPGQLSVLSAVSGPSTTNRILRLQRRGLITRAVDSRDRRAARVQLTPAGRTLVDRLLPEFLACEQELLKALPAGQLTHLDALVDRLLATLEPDG